MGARKKQLVQSSRCKCERYIKCERDIKCEREFTVPIGDGHGAWRRVAWVHGCKGAWVQGCMGARVHGCKGAWENGGPRKHDGGKHGAC